MPTGVNLVRIIKLMKTNMVTNTTNLHSDNNNLFVLIGANRLSYFITSPNKQVLAQHSQSLDSTALADVFQKNKDLSQSFQIVKVGFVTPYSTLVPNLIYKEDAATSYLENSFRIPQQHYLLTDNVHSLQCQNVYLAPISVYNFFQKQFDAPNFFHCSTSLLVAWQEQAVEFQEPTVFINVVGNSFQIAAFKRERLLISNTYEFKSEKDFIYYTLLIFKQLELNVETSKLYLSGEVMKASEIYKLLYRYIRDIRFLKQTNDYNFNTKQDNESEHLNFDLYSFSKV